jgi:hypothetical protein
MGLSTLWPRTSWMLAQTADLCRTGSGMGPIKNAVVYVQLTSHRRDEGTRKLFMSPYIV